MDNGVLKLDKTVNLDSALDGALEIVKLVKPDWIAEEINVKIFDNGITNKMFGFGCGTIIKQSTSVLVRVNGKGTERFMNRAEEAACFQTMHKFGCAPRLYCIFNNGLCYEYIDGCTLSKEDVQSPNIFRPLTEELARVHSIPSAIANPKPKTFSVIRKFLDIAFETTTSAKSLVHLSALEEMSLRREVDELESCLNSLNSPIVFCHNDLLLHNIIYNRNTGVVKFIDYEYAGFNHQAYDIGNHFCEFAGIDDIDFNLYPDKNFQLEWLKSYVRAWHVQSKSDKPLTAIEEAEKVATLYKQVNKFALAAHLFWGIWSLVQARYSLLDFDYVGYSKRKLEEYYRRKEKFLAL